MTTEQLSKAKVAVAADVAPPAAKTNYPAPFAARVDGRVKRRLGDAVGLKNFGVNLTRLAPGSMSALLHRHSIQDEFVYVLEGTLTLVAESGESLLGPGSCAGFAAGGEAHHLVNRSASDVVYLEVGDRSAGDEVSYPADDLKATFGPDRKWVITHKDGTPY
jgi:uncharacterized cupin superfamily protein